MAFELKLNRNLSKEKKYILLQPQIRSLIEGEKNFIANLANITSVLKQMFNKFIWVGFYLIEEEGNELVLGPFQGKTACTRIPVGRGVCGTSALKRESIIVDDISTFPGHITCDADSRSEIVIPVMNKDKLEGVLDIDSNHISAFDNIDRKYLEMIIKDISYIFTESRITNE